MGKSKENSGSIAKTFKALVGCAQRIGTVEALEREKAIPGGRPPFCMRFPPMSDLLLLLLLYWDGLDAFVDLSAAQRAQDDLRCSLA